jgi:hypothetical protein
MENTSQCGLWGANEAELSPSFLKEGWSAGAACGWRIPSKFSLRVLSLAILLGGCGAEAPKPATQVEAKPAEPAIPEEVQAAATAFLGSESQVLAFGDLAKNGKQQFLAANVVPKTPTNNLPGTIVTRAIVAENDDGKWVEVLRCDEHLKNPKGYLGLTPLAPVTGWRLQFEQNAEKGLQLYFTPLQGTTDSHVLPIGVRWNPATKRYQSLDRTYEHFLLESPALNDVRSRLR